MVVWGMSMGGAALGACGVALRCAAVPPHTHDHMTARRDAAALAISYYVNLGLLLVYIVWRKPHTEGTWTGWTWEAWKVRPPHRRAAWNAWPNGRSCSPGGNI